MLGRDEVTERRACQVLGQARNTHRRKASVADDEPPLVKRIVWMASEYGRYGYRRITALLRAEGWWVNHKRVERIWRQEGLKVPAKQPKRRRRGRLAFLSLDPAYGVERTASEAGAICSTPWSDLHHHRRGGRGGGRVTRPGFSRVKGGPARFLGRKAVLVRDVQARKGALDGSSASYTSSLHTTTHGV
jgi:transposase InsO family protein